MGVFGHLQGQTAADVAGQSHIIPRILEDVVDERCGGRLAVAAGDANHLRVGVTTGELYFADDVDVTFTGLHNDGCVVGDAGTLHNLVGIEDFLQTVVTFLPLNMMVVELLLVTVLDG